METPECWLREALRCVASFHGIVDLAHVVIAMAFFNAVTVPLYNFITTPLVKQRDRFFNYLGWLEDVVGGVC